MNSLKNFTHLIPFSIPRFQRAIRSEIGSIDDDSDDKFNDRAEQTTRHRHTTVEIDRVERR
jgi:hypothetical protein